MTRTTTTLKHQTKLIALVDRHIATCTTFRDTVSRGNTDISEMTASMASIRDHVSHRQRPAIAAAQRAAQLELWTAEAADVLRGQGNDPVVRKNQIVWRDAGHLHTIVFGWYDDSQCVRMHYDHHTGSVFAAEARRLELKEYNLRGYTSVVPPHTSRLELTTLPAEMSKVIVWALSGRVGDSPCEWVKYGDRNIWTTAAVTTYRQ